MAKRKPKLEFRYYEIEPNEQVLALLGENWRRTYGKDIDRLHFHNYMEVGICHEGHGETILRDKVQSFEEECVIIVPPNYPHSNMADFGTTAYWEWLYLDIDSVLQDMKELSFSKLDTDYMRNELYKTALFFHQKEYPKISDIILKVREECDKKAYMYRETVKGLLQSFVVELLRIHNVHADMPRKSARNFQIAPALSYVKGHYNEEIKIQNLAEVCGISETHFRRIFQECMNMGPNDYINVIRIQEASRLLLKSFATMEEIAFQVGYGDVSTFTRNFKKMFGMTPYQWKRSPDNYSGHMLDSKVSVLRGWE
ncbi:MAG: AraC family transcriptional regulator [Clostridia bacterium]|uniref:AraC family transcriptional regulator n=1 Tax=Sporofaciens musculi TaxID=2681861 RepID=UPI0025A185ED|nr:AraC family transcriptional regulator [Sporofaciens musculi]MCI8363074.1 AraC family transcriptional regulator [Clostridia bacterium]